MLLDLFETWTWASATSGGNINTAKNKKPNQNAKALLLYIDLSSFG
jgi:hypothetical protein